MIKFFSFSLWIIILLSGHFGFSQNDSVFPPPENPPVIQVIKVESKMSVDGKLDEDEWQKGEGIVDFFKREPRQGGTIRYQTKVKFLYDNKYLYVGAWCKDSLGIKGIRVQDLRRDFSWGENDLFGVALDPKTLNNTHKHFKQPLMGINATFRILMVIPLILAGIRCGKSEQCVVKTAILLKWQFHLKHSVMTHQKRESL